MVLCMYVMDLVKREACLLYLILTGLRGLGFSFFFGCYVYICTDRQIHFAGEGGLVNA